MRSPKQVKKYPSLTLVHLTYTSGRHKQFSSVMIPRLHLCASIGTAHCSCCFLSSLLNHSISFVRQQTKLRYWRCRFYKRCLTATDPKQLSKEHASACQECSVVGEKPSVYVTTILFIYYLFTCWVNSLVDSYKYSTNIERQQQIAVTGMPIKKGKKNRHWDDVLEVKVKMKRKEDTHKSEMRTS